MLLPRLCPAETSRSLASAVPPGVFGARDVFDDEAGSTAMQYTCGASDAPEMLADWAALEISVGGTAASRGLCTFLNILSSLIYSLLFMLSARRSRFGRASAGAAG